MIFAVRVTIVYLAYGNRFASSSLSRFRASSDIRFGVGRASISYFVRIGNISGDENSDDNDASFSAASQAATFSRAILRLRALWASVRGYVTMNSRSTSSPIAASIARITDFQLLIVGTVTNIEVSLQLMLPATQRRRSLGCIVMGWTISVVLAFSLVLAFSVVLAGSMVLARGYYDCVEWWLWLCLDDDGVR